MSDVTINILDGGAAVVVPSASVQVVIGPSSSGTPAQVVATQNPNTIQQNFGYGPMPEAGALSALAGGTVLAMKAATITAGLVRNSNAAPINIVSSTNATPIVVTTAINTLQDGDIVEIAGHLVNTAAVGVWKVNQLTTTTFELVGSVGVGVGGATGTVQIKGINLQGTGTSEITVTGTPNDYYYVKFLCTFGGTLGAVGILGRISLDGGRNYGPTLSLGTALTYAIPNTGLTLNFSAGTLVTGDYATFSCIGPKTDTASIIACLTALQNGPYAVAGWGSLHIVEELTGADAATISTYLDTMATNFQYTRAIASTRDASPPRIWGGTAETETAWILAIQTDVSALSSKRELVTAGHYNTPSAFPNPIGGSPRYRRPLSWSLAARQVAIPPQRHAGRVKDGSLSTIVIDPTLDPLDGFIYHDERVQAGLTAARFCCARTRIKLPGLYIDQPNLMSPLGSVFTILPLGNVMDIACGIVHQVGQQDINSDIRLNPNGTIYENEAKAIENNFLGNIKVQMIDTGEISGATVTVNRSWNVLSSSTVKVAVSILARGYILNEEIEIGFANPLAATGS